MCILRERLGAAKGAFLALLTVGTLAAQGAVANTQSLGALPSRSGTQHKPQSKTWRHGGRWWCVLDDASGISRLHRLNGSTWTTVLALGLGQNRTADVVVDGDNVHILLHTSNAASVDFAELWSLSYDHTTGLYSPWTTATTPQVVLLAQSAETATLALDSEDRLWVAYDDDQQSSSIYARYSERPYTDWTSVTAPIATGVSNDDIAAVVALPSDHIGVMWSDQNSGAFGFRTRADTSTPELIGSWSTPEVPPNRLGSSPFDADDHINLAVTPDGTLLAAVKTSLDTAGDPVIGLLVRRPSGSWDPAYHVVEATVTGDREPTRPNVIWDELSGTATVMYCSRRIGLTRKIAYRQTGLHGVSFGPEQILMSAPSNTLCDISTTQQTVEGEFVAMASTPGIGFVTSSVLAHIDRAPRAFYRFESTSGSVVADLSGEGNQGAILGGATHVAGVTGSALSCDGIDDHVLVPDSADLDLTRRLTLAAWVRPNGVGTQYLIKKAVNGVVDGYELSLSNNGRAFVRFNERSFGNAMRVDTVSSYPIDGSWMHLAATYDGATIRLYVNGVEEASLPVATAIAENDNPLVIGAQSDGTGFQWPLNGAIDDVEVIGRALTAREIACRAQALTAATVGHYAFEGTSTTSVIDGSGEGNDGTIFGAPVRVPGVYGQALELDGVGDHVSVPHTASLSPSCRLSLSAWVRPEFVGTQYLIKKAVNERTDGFELALSASGKAFARINALHSGNTFRIDSPVPYPANGTTWTHLAAVFDGAFLRLYVDGAEVAVQPAVVDIRDNSLPVTIGGQHDGSVLTLPFRGAIDEVEVLARALTPEEIRCRAFGPGSFDFVGPGCQNPGGLVATLSMPTPPAIGSTNQVEFGQGSPISIAVLAVGFDRLLPPQGLELLALGAPGCFLHPNPVQTVSAVTDPSGNTAWTIPIAENTSLLGAELFLQAVAIESAAGTGLSFSASNAHRLLLGCAP